MKIELKKNTSFLLIKPAGELTIYTAGGLKQYFIAEGLKYPEIRIDLSGITLLDSAGFQLLLAARGEAERKAKQLLFENPSADVLRLFAVYREKIEDWNKT